MSCCCIYFYQIEIYISCNLTCNLHKTKQSDIGGCTTFASASEGCSLKSCNVSNDDKTYIPNNNTIISLN